jgi:hypothetical protein
VINVVTVVALLMSIAAFVMFIHLLVRKQSHVETVAAKLPSLASIDDLAKLVEALARLAESLGKAGPAVTAFIASVLFLVLAMAGAGVVAFSS